jgi:hypothetical protein
VWNNYSVTKVVKVLQGREAAQMGDTNLKSSLRPVTQLGPLSYYIDISPNYSLNIPKTSAELGLHVGYDLGPNSQVERKGRG